MQEECSLCVELHTEFLQNGSFVVSLTDSSTLVQSYKLIVRLSRSLKCCEVTLTSSNGSSTVERNVLVASENAFHAALALFFPFP